MLEIIAVGDHYQPVAGDTGLDNLKPVVADYCRERFRRIDRFTQLALIGSGRCVAGRTLPPDTGLYIGSRFASLGNTTKVHEQMVGAGVVPKPANFINTLSNSAGYFVARNLGLGHRNLFVSRGDASLVAALQLAAMDMATGTVSSALIGAVDEAVLPLEDHRFRLGLTDDTPLGEGSHWLLTAPAGHPGSLATITDMVTLTDADRLAHWLEGLDSSIGYCLSRSPWTRQHTNLACLEGGAGLEIYHSDLAAYPGHAAGALLRYLQSGNVRPLIVVAADNDGRFHALVVRPRES